MPLIDEDGFSRLLKTDFTENKFLIFGDDAYLKEVYSDRLIKAVIMDENLKFFNFHTYSNDETPLEDIFEDADNLPVMAEKTMLLINNYPLNELSEKALRDFEEKLKSAPDTCVLAFYYSSQDFTYNNREFPKWTAIIDLFKRLGIAAELSHRSGRKIINMLIKGAASRNTSIGEDEAAYLVETCGEDTGNLLNEFNKLCSYADGAPITKEMIDDCVIKSVSASVFDISTAIFSGDADKAFRITNELLRQKVAVQSIIGALNQSYMTIYRYKTAANANKTVSDFANKLGYKDNQTYVFSKIAPFANKINMDKLRRSLDVLIEADIKSKSTSIEPATLITEVIAKLSALN